MIRINLDAILQARGRTVYWLGKQTGLTTKTLYFLKHEKVKEVSLNCLSRICEALDCEVGDILVRESKPRKAGGKKRANKGRLGQSRKPKKRPA